MSVSSRFSARQAQVNGGECRPQEYRQSQESRMSQPRPHQAAARALLVLLTCVGLAAGSLAATHGGGAKDRAGAVVAAARTHVGDRYAWGAPGPDTFDCSGLTSTLWTKTG